MRLLRDVGLDHLVSDVATPATKVAPCPDVAPPKPFTQVRELAEQALGAFPLHPLDQTTDGDVGRDRDHHMDMIRGDMPLQDIDARLLAFFADKRANPFRHLATQHFVAILGDPDDREMDRQRRVGAMAIVTHAPKSSENLLKLPPKGGGFAPSQLETINDFCRCL